MDEDYNGVIGIVYRKDNPLRFALIYNKNTGNVGFPAGGREREENSNIETLRREIHEETGLAPDEYTPVKTSIVHEFKYNFKKKERKGQMAKQLVYLIETIKLNLSPLDGNVKFLGWFTKEEVLSKLTFEDSKKMFEKALNFL
jgi:8-oxo-dGTP pyrophosphatase MutT (NUDIX family)